MDKSEEMELLDQLEDSIECVLSHMKRELNHLAEISYICQMPEIAEEVRAGLLRAFADLRTTAVQIDVTRNLEQNWQSS